jgi:transposase InsO family protein
MAMENGWRARKIREELSKLGIHLGLTTVSRYLPKVAPRGDPQQRWTTFLRNHRDLIAGMDFFVVPTVRFQLLYVWFALDHGRRRVLHFNVTAHPAADWVVQQLRDAFPDTPEHRFLIFDNDAIFSTEVARSIRRFGIHPRRTALQSPWQNGTAERFVGTVRRELLDHVVVLSEDHLRNGCFANTSRTTTPSASTPRSPTRRKSEHPRRSRRDRLGSFGWDASAVFTADTRGARQRESA